MTVRYQRPTGSMSCNTQQHGSLTWAGMALVTAGSTCPCGSLSVGPLCVFVQVFPIVKLDDEHPAYQFLRSLWRLIS